MKLNRFNLIYLVAAIIVVIAFFFFRWSNQQSEYKTQQVINSLLRNESLIANSYALSKSILDLEKLGLIRCSELIEDFTEKRVFYSTINQNHCYQLKILKYLNDFSFDSKAVNGLNYRITLQLNMPWQSIMLEYLIYFLLLLGAINLKKHLQKQEEISLIRLKASEIEKQMFLDKTMQIRHDVASPIASMKLFLDILKDIDPRVREMFKLSIDRTQELFNQLNADINMNKLEPCLINNIVQGIINEKRADTKSGVDIIFTSSLEIETHVLANKLELERLLSNLLNNSLEALADRSVKRIELVLALTGNIVEMNIIDSGKGIPQHLIQKIGNKGFSYGKENHQTSGSGLGLYHAMTTIKSWKGEFVISSKEGQGTNITIKIPVVNV